jgi:hypothetical protein
MRHRPAPGPLDWPAPSPPGGGVPAAVPTDVAAASGDPHPEAALTRQRSLRRGATAAARPVVGLAAWRPLANVGAHTARQRTHLRPACASHGGGDDLTLTAGEASMKTLHHRCCTEPATKSLTD